MRNPPIRDYVRPHGLHWRHFAPPMAHILIIASAISRLSGHSLCSHLIPGQSVNSRVLAARSHLFIRLCFVSIAPLPWPWHTSNHTSSFPLFNTNILERRLMVMLFSHDTIWLRYQSCMARKIWFLTFAKYLFWGRFCAGALWCFLGESKQLTCFGAFLTTDWRWRLPCTRGALAWRVGLGTS